MIREKMMLNHMVEFNKKDMNTPPMKAREDKPPSFEELNDITVGNFGSDDKKSKATDTKSVKKKKKIIRKKTTNTASENSQVNGGN